MKLKTAELVASQEEIDKFVHVTSNVADSFDLKDAAKERFMEMVTTLYIVGLQVGHRSSREAIEHFSKMVTEVRQKASSTDEHTSD